MNVALWVIQGLLAAAYLFAGAMKSRRPIESLSKSMPWTGSIPRGFVRFIGVAEVLGALGLILPLATGILPWLTVAAAVGLVIVQVCAVVFHLTRREEAQAPINLVMLILAVVVAYGRLVIVPA